MDMPPTITEDLIIAGMTLIGVIIILGWMWLSRTSRAPRRVSSSQGAQLHLEPLGHWRYIQRAWESDPRWFDTEAAFGRRYVDHVVQTLSKIVDGSDPLVEVDTELDLAETRDPKTYELELNVARLILGDESGDTGTTAWSKIRPAIHKEFVDFNAISAELDSMGLAGEPARHIRRKTVKTEQAISTTVSDADLGKISYIDALVRTTLLSKDLDTYAKRVLSGLSDEARAELIRPPGSPRLWTF